MPKSPWARPPAAKALGQLPFSKLRTLRPSPRATRRPIHRALTRRWAPGSWLRRPVASPVRPTASQGVRGVVFRDGGGAAGFRRRDVRDIHSGVMSSHPSKSTMRLATHAIVHVVGPWKFSPAQFRSRRPNSDAETLTARNVPRPSYWVPRPRPLLFLRIIGRRPGSPSPTKFGAPPPPSA